MSNEEIKQLIQLVTESGINELEVQRGENRVRIQARGASHETFVAVPTHSPAPASSSHPAPAPAASASAPAPSGAAAQDATLVKSPIVGTYYDAPSPGAAPFVKVGDNVEPGQVLCIIESMKLMNEIEAEVSGTVVAKLMENGRPVEYGEALFAIRPRS
jgi:acetyl-CoA carboxylase biotin carboxyl carrier protein